MLAFTAEQLHDGNLKCDALFCAGIKLFDVTAALYAPFQKQSLPNAISGDLPCDLSPGNAGQIVGAAVMAVDRQHKVAYAAAKRGAPQGRSFTQNAFKENAVELAAVSFGELLGKDGNIYPVGLT